MMVRVIYETTEDCNKCPFNHGRICMKLGKYLFDICFENDCPLPTLEEVEQFTRYITSDRGLDCCGNCRNWSRWQYNKHIKRDIGVCCADGKRVYTCDSEACEEFDEL